MSPHTDTQTDTQTQTQTQTQTHTHTHTHTHTQEIRPHSGQLKKFMGQKATEIKRGRAVYGEAETMG